MPSISSGNNSGLYDIDSVNIPIDDNILANNITATGNVTVGGYIIANGSITTNSNFVGNLVGNLIGNIALTGSNTQVIFNDSGVTGGSNAFTFNKATNAVAITGTLSATGNITGDYILGNGSQLTGLPATYSNANVVSLMASFGSNTISTSGNITGGYILGNGSQLTGLPQQYGNANVADYLASGTNTQNIVTSGTVQGNILQTAGAGGNITGANYISANYFVGDGSFLTNVSGNLAGNMQGNIQGNGFGISNLAFLSVTGASTLANLSITGGANIDVGNNRITNVATPSIGTDAATKDYVDSVASSGFTIEDDTANTTTVAGGDTLELLGTANQVSVAITANDQVTFSLPSAISVSGNITGGNITTAGSVSATGNITANYFIGNGSQLTGLTSTYSNANVANYLVTYNGNIGSLPIVTGNNLPAYIYANTIVAWQMQSLDESYFEAVRVNDYVRFNNNTEITPTSLLISGTGNITGNLIFANATTAGQISAAGNITANYYFGNGSQLTGLPATYSNANVATFLANFGSNTISTTGNITSGNIIANGQFLTNLPAANVTGTVANATYALSANSATFAGTVTTNAQPNITSVGTLTSLTSTGTVTAGNLLTGGLISATGNITANYYFGNGSQLTGITSDYGNGNVANYLPTYSGNIGAGNIIFTSNAGVAYVNNITGLAGQPVTITADSTENINLDADTIRVGDNNTDATIVTHGTGDLILTTHQGSAAEGNIILRDGASGNIDIQTNGSGVVNITGTAGLRVADGISAVGNITGANLRTTGLISATGNIDSAGLINAIGAVITNITAPGNIQGGNILANTGVISAGTVSATGNITGGNITTAGIFTASNVTANLQMANIITNNQQIQTVAARNPGAITATAADPGRIVIGTLFGGNLSPGIDIGGQGRGARLTVGDSVSVADIQQRVSGLVVQQYSTATANITSSNTRVVGLSSQHQIGGGSSANTFGQSATAATLGASSGLIIGGGTSGNLTSLGNTTVTTAAAQNAVLQVATGSVLRSGVCQYSTVLLQGGNIGNAIGFSGPMTATSGSFTGNVYMFYNPGNATDFGFGHANSARSATNYYFLRNDDNAAQTKMGAMRLWHDYRYDHTTTTGAITVDKNNGQTQYLAVTGNITGITLSNFVTTASDGTNTDQEMDTVTLWLRQDATGRTITMPTGANYFYESGTTTVPTTANSVSRIDFTAIDNASTTQYLIKISAAYTST